MSSCFTGGCSSWRPSNSVRALKAKHVHLSQYEFRTLDHNAQSSHWLWVMVLHSTRHKIGRNLETFFPASLLASTEAQSTHCTISVLDRLSCGHQYCCCWCYDSYERIEIPLYIQTVDGVSMPCLQSLVRLPDILCQEEDDLYRSAKEACCSDLAAMIHNGSGECSLCD